MHEYLISSEVMANRLWFELSLSLCLFFILRNLVSIHVVRRCLYTWIIYTPIEYHAHPIMMGLYLYITATNVFIFLSPSTFVLVSYFACSLFLYLSIGGSVVLFLTLSVWIRISIILPLVLHNSEQWWTKPFSNSTSQTNLFINSTWKMSLLARVLTARSSSFWKIQ